MKNSNYLIFYSIFFLLLGLNLTFAQYDSSILFHNNLNQLTYVSDKDGNHIPDFSFAGYKNGEAALPNVAVVKQISPVAGDNTAHIQAAIDEVEALTPNADGHRGALLLSPGEYRVNGVLFINKVLMVYCSLIKPVLCFVVLVMVKILHQIQLLLV